MGIQLKVISGDSDFSFFLLITEKDGCIEQFENSAAFSRAYQAAQDCMCDNEHMFDCSTRGSENQPMSFQKPVNSALRRIMAEIKQIPNEHKTLAAKKFFEKRVGINLSLLTRCGSKSIIY